MQCGKEVGEYSEDESCTAELDGSQEPLEALEGATSTCCTNHLMETEQWK